MDFRKHYMHGAHGHGYCPAHTIGIGYYRSGHYFSVHIFFILSVSVTNVVKMHKLEKEMLKVGCASELMSWQLSEEAIFFF